MRNRKNILLLLAGGKGLRMQNERPKQFVEILGKPVFVHALLPFQSHEEVDDIYVVCSEEWREYVVEMAKKSGISKFRGVFSSGQESIDSLRNGVAGIRALYPEENPTIITHEAVRPLISAAIISENLKTFAANGNAVTAATNNEAYLVSSDGFSSTECQPRERFFLAQMPQTFSLEQLEKTFEEAARKGIVRAQSLYTLYAEVFPESPVFIARSTTVNMKITHPEDIAMVEAYLSIKDR